MNKMTEHFSQRLNEKYYSAEHKSGLKLLVFPKKLTTCHAVIGTKFGSSDLLYKRNGKVISLPAGTAHFLEHKMFESKDGISADERFTLYGADANAYTSYNTTRYLFSATHEYEKCLYELLKMVRQPYFTADNIKKERGIITQEILMDNDDPYERVMSNCLSIIHNDIGMRESICGSVKSVSKINKKLLYEAYESFYSSQSMILSVCGDINPNAVLDIADQLFDADASSPKIELLTEAETKNVRQSRIEQKMNVARPLFFIGLKSIIPSNIEARYRRSMLANILNNMVFSGTGEFYNRLLSDRLITPAFSFGYSSGRQCAVNYFSGNSDDPELVYSLVCEKLKETANTPSCLDNDDFTRCKRALLASFLKSFDSCAEIADDIMFSYTAGGIDPFELPELIEGLTFEEVKELASELFCVDNNIALSLILPND